jgi:hypothetical protein
MPINAADGETFPWLSKLAANFEHYKFNSIKFHYQSSVSSFLTGAVVMTPEYDPANFTETAPSSLATLLNKEGSVTGNVWMDFSMNMNHKKMNEEYYCRPHHRVTKTAEHLRQTDMANVYIALYNITTANDLPYGEIFVEYDVVLSTPNLIRHNKSATISNPSAAHPGGLGDYAPALGVLGGAQPQYLATDDSTLAVRTQYIGDGHPLQITDGPNDVHANRFIFEEPFHGLATYRVENATGTGHAAGNEIIVNDSTWTRAAGDIAQWATTNLLHYAFDATDLDGIGLIEVNALAGDVMDIVSSVQNGVIAADLAEITFTEVAEGLLSLLFL